MNLWIWEYRALMASYFVMILIVLGLSYYARNRIQEERQRTIQCIQTNLQCVQTVYTCMSVVYMCESHLEKDYY